MARKVQKPKPPLLHSGWVGPPPPYILAMLRAAKNPTKTKAV